MNFKIQQTYPGPTQGLSNYNTLTYAQNINSLVLYGQQKLVGESAPQPAQKKKIAFKVDKSAPAPSSDKISIFSVLEQKWSVIQAKGKIPSSRSQFKSIFMHPCLIMYGGKVNGKNVNEVYALNCETWIWKKLFSIDGPPTTDEYKFFKISNLTAGLITSGNLWLLQIADVKWQLSANQLPGSVWQKTNIKIPQNIQFCWPISQQNLLIIGQKQTIKFDTKTKEKVSEFEFNFFKKVVHSSKQHQFKIINVFFQKLAKQNNEILQYTKIVSTNSVNLLKYKRKNSQNLDEGFDYLTQNEQKYKNYIQLERPVKCCSYILNKDKGAKSIFYIDIKGELLSINMSIDPQILNCQQNTTRLLSRQSVQRNNRDQRVNNSQEDIILQNNSCILQEQQNQQSSLLVPSANSRIKLQNNSRIQNRSQSQQQDENISGVQNKRSFQFNKKQQNNGRKHEIKKMTIMHDGIRGSPNDQQQNIKQQSKSAKQKHRPSNIIVGANLGTGRKNNYNTNNSQTNPSEKTPNNQRFKYKTQQHTDKNLQWQTNKNHNQKKKDVDGTPQQIRQKLQNILYNQSVKRKLLESKVEILQNIIKKSEKFVLMLCKYGNNTDKQIHIQKVREIRQELQWNWTKQNYYRKQMQGNKLPSQISQQIQQTMSNIEL